MRLIWLPSLPHWYLIGYLQPINELRLFAVDRITDLKSTNDTFDANSNQSIPELFDDIIGLNYSSQEPEKVLLKFDALQAKYISTLPLHHFQRIISDSDNGVVAEYTIKPNFEFQ